MLNKKTERRRVLGIDPGYERLGYAVVEKFPGQKEKIIASGCIITPSSLPHNKRLSLLSKGIEEVIKKLEPYELCVEKLFFNTNQKTALLVSEARGVVIEKGSQMGLSIKELTPAQIKIAVAGDGRADKNQMIKMVKILTGFDRKGALDDEYDAIAAALASLSINDRL